jgi:hypothetical protein
MKRRGEKNGVAVGTRKKKGDEYGEDLLPIGSKSEEMADLKRYDRMF